MPHTEPDEPHCGPHPDAPTEPLTVRDNLGSVGGAFVFHGPRLTRQFDRTIDLLHRRLDAETGRCWLAGCTSRSTGTRSSWRQ